MKIPETAANVGAYYGNEENGQWQPNGVIIDSGVGGGVVGSGDAGIHRPPVYPVHIPRAHMPGYVMAGAYYPPAAYPPVPTQPQPDDFADYMWMENEEEFDKQVRGHVMQQLEEEALMEQCIEAMLEDEQRERQHRPTNGHNPHYPTPSPVAGAWLAEAVSRSTLNPLAAEFVPTRPLPAATDERQDPPDVPPATSSHKTDDTPTEHPPSDITAEEQDKTEEPVPPQKDPPEVSAADSIDKIIDKRPKDKRDSKTKIELKKPLNKPEIKSKAKPQTVKSETKVTPKKKEVKSIKSDVKVEELKVEEVIDTKPQPAPVEETQTCSGFKPINYAAAAKANKPKKPAATIDKPQTQPKIEKAKITEKIDKKDKPKTEKINIQRKNSAK